MKVSFVIPCYCSEKTIESVVEDIKLTMQGKDEYEIILLNDASTDHTFRKIEDLCKKNDNIIGVDFAKNFGQHSALMAGFHYVTGDVVVCLDDDGQTPPGEVYKLLNALSESVDVVYAEYANKKHSAFRNLGSRLNAKMAEYLIGKPKELFVSSYFVAKRYVIDEIISYRNPYPYVIGLILRTTKNIVNVEVDHRERQEGSSGYTLRKLFMLWLNGFTAFSVKPLRVATGVGISFAGIGFCYAVYTVVKKFLNPAVPVGWSSMMAAILIIGGCILFMLGLIGEYIGRIYISLNNSPQYVVKNLVNYKGKKDES